MGGGGDLGTRGFGNVSEGGKVLEVGGPSAMLSHFSDPLVVTRAMLIDWYALGRKSSGPSPPLSILALTKGGLQCHCSELGFVLPIHLHCANAFGGYRCL